MVLGPIGLFLLTFLISVVSIYFCRYIAIRFGFFLDLPNQRSSHQKPVPRCGGLPIVIIFTLMLLYYSGIVSAKSAGFIIGGCAIALVGLMDDLFNLKGKYKIAGMVISSIIPIAFGLRLEYLTFITENPILLTILSLIWIYGMINAFNFMDGIDGLISGISVIFTAFLALYAIFVGNLFVFSAALILAAACAAFLLFNFNPSSIFLGDIGSMFLGYNMAILSIMLVNQSHDKVPIYVLVILLSPIIYDAITTFIKRAIQGKNVIEAHREHLYQRLVILGHSHRFVSLIYFALALLCGLIGYIFILSGMTGRIILSILTAAIMLGFSIMVTRLEIQAKRMNNG